MSVSCAALCNLLSPHVKPGWGERERNNGREGEEIGSKGGHKVRNEVIESRRRKLDVGLKLMNEKCKGKKIKKDKQIGGRQIHDSQDRARTWNEFLFEYQLQLEGNLDSS